MAKKKTKKSKTKKQKVEMMEHFVTILLGLKNNRAEELENLFNMGYVYKSEIASRAGVYVTLSKMLEVVDHCEDCDSK